jgi:hypothetical protein
LTLDLEAMVAQTVQFGVGPVQGALSFRPSGGPDLSVTQPSPRILMAPGGCGVGAAFAGSRRPNRLCFRLKLLTDLTDPYEPRTSCEDRAPYIVTRVKYGLAPGAQANMVEPEHSLKAFSRLSAERRGEWTRIGWFVVRPQERLSGPPFPANLEGDVTVLNYRANPQ